MVSKLLLIVIVGATFTNNGYADTPSNEPLIGLGVEHFQWKESASNGSQYLKETGKRYLLTFINTSTRSPELDYDLRVEVYKGGVNYDGQTQGGIPLKAITDYIGLRLEMAADNYLSGAAGVQFGLGFDMWTRKLNDSTTVLGTPSTGYTEDYDMGYFKLGFVWRASSHDWKQKFIVGLKRPVFVEETIREFGLHLSPKPTTTLYSSWNNVFAVSRNSKLGIELFYERTHFNPSDPSMGAYQPDSDMRTTGVRLLLGY
ncbi:MAG: hypothetical protein HY080_11275 [Gammaproteobacteria bacterium]|nr:hypothetical protein [Gammaproteobacteria bacterium]